MNPDCKADILEIDRCKLKSREEVERFVEQLLLAASALWPEIIEDGEGTQHPN